MSPTGAGASRFGTGFVEPVGEDGFGVRRSPMVGQHLFQLWIVRVQAEEKFSHVDPGFDAMAFPCQDGAQHGRPWASGFAAQEEPVLPADRLVAKSSLADVVVDRQAAIFGVTA